MSIRLGVVVTELERLPLETIAEYLAALQADARDEPPALDQELMSVFGNPAHRKLR